MDYNEEKWIPKEYIVIVGKNIKKFRKQKKLTQAQLAARLSVSRSYICQLEYGIKVSMSRIRKISDVLGVSLNELFED